MNTALSPEARAPYELRFAELVRACGPSWLAPLRQAAFDSFVSLGWPNLKQEAWRFTDVKPITNLDLLPGHTLASELDPLLFDPQCFLLGAHVTHRMVLLDGHHQATRRQAQDGAAGLRLMPLSLAEAGLGPQASAHFSRHLHNLNAFVALNTAFMNDGAFVHIPAGLRCQTPIVLVHLAAGTDSPSFPRTLVVAEPDSQATLVEVHLGANGRVTMASSATEIALGVGARLDYHSIQKSAPEGFHIGHVAVTQESGSTFSGHSLTLGGRIARRDVRVRLAGEGCTCNLDGIYLADGDNHLDNQTTIDHSSPRSVSREDYRGAIAGKGHAVFSGHVIVRPGAAKTDAQQTNRNLLLSSTAQVDSKPQLEILTSDVKCSHGATSGRLDPEALFYLRSRGIGESQAQRLLVRAFLQQGLERVVHDGLRAELEGLLDHRIDELMAQGETSCR
jgi:Fe-S cluster assembly protein SufD